jgi:hypothetical protein
MENDLYQFVVSDYFATGEGRTISILITRAYPRHDDYLEQPSFDKDYNYSPGTLKTTAEERAFREFEEFFDDFTARGGVVLYREEFLESYEQFIPEMLRKLLQDSQQPGNLNFKTKLHVNFS